MSRFRSLACCTPVSHSVSIEKILRLLLPDAPPFLLCLFIRRNHRYYENVRLPMHHLLYALFGCSANCKVVYTYYCTLLIAECIGPPTVGTSLLYCMNGFNQQCRAHASIALFDRMYVDFRSGNSVVQREYGLSMRGSHPYSHAVYTSQYMLPHTTQTRFRRCGLQLTG